MKPEAQRIAIAEACGWTPRPATLPENIHNWNDPQGNMSTGSQLPDYLTDLNAMHEAEKVLNRVQRVQYWNELRSVIRAASPVVCCEDFDMLHATAAQRAEAFLRTLGKWAAKKEERS